MASRESDFVHENERYVRQLFTPFERETLEQAVRDDRMDRMLADPDAYFAAARKKRRAEAVKSVAADIAAINKKARQARRLKRRRTLRRVARSQVPVVVLIAVTAFLIGVGLANAGLL